MGTSIDSSRRRYGPVGECIYCGSKSDLRREHIIPSSLRGTWVLAKASCEICAKITREFEQKVAREMFGAFRAQFGLPSSTHKKGGGIRIVPLDIEKAGKQHTEHFPAHDMPIVPVLMPLYPSPGILSNRAPSVGFPPQLDCLIWRPSKKKQRQGSVIEELVTPQVSGVWHTINISEDAFCRMLAKIAHAATIAHYGLGAVPSFLADYILGRNQAFLHVVGCSPDPCGHISDHVPWGIEFGTFNRGDQHFSTVKIELFRFLFLSSIKDGRGPTYWVTVGPADQRLTKFLAKTPPYPLPTQ